MTRRVRVVLVDHDGGALTLDAVRRILAARAAEPGVEVEVVVVDNASSRPVRAEVEALGARTIALARNVGFGLGCNAAFGDLEGLDAVVLLNNDAWPQAGWLAPLLDALGADERLGAVCPKVLRPHVAEQPDVIDRIGGVLYEGGFGGDLGAGEIDGGQYDDGCELFAWTGCAVALRPAYLADAGWFDPLFFLYYEDFELSWRGRRLGWRYRSVPSSVVRHLGGATIGHGSPLHRAETVRNRLVTLAIHAPGALVVRQLLAEIHSALRHERRVRVRAIAAFVRALPRALRRRQALERTARVPRSATMAWAVARPRRDGLAIRS
jgi:N-acetylglucosaminyl-diphospho-decaprenol L-rhamnosyltransferase